MRSLFVGAGLRSFFFNAALVVLLSPLALATSLTGAEAARKRQGYAPPFASMVYDVQAGKVLQSTEGDSLRHPASITKVMTLYMLFEQLERGRFTLKSELPVSATASRQAPSKLGLKPGETITVEDAIMALVTKSANDVAVVVAEAIGEDQDRFAAMMTQKARQLGMARSVFRNASGLPDREQVTTARDLVTLGRAIHDRFPRYYAYFSERDFAYDGAVYKNHNRLLGKVEGMDGIKTGYTAASGFNLLSSVKADGRHIITVVLGGRSARARDAQVANLIDAHITRAYAGRRLGTKPVEVASNEDTPAEKPARTSQPEAGAALPLPPQGRPRPAVIAESGGEQGLTRGRPAALAASGNAGMQSATTPLALVGTTPRSPALRWVNGPQGVTIASAKEGRIVPPGSVRYTNGIPDDDIGTDETQPLPVAEAMTPGSKVEQRLGASPAKPVLLAQADLAAKRVETAPQKDEANEKPAPAQKAMPVTTRSGWVIQLAAADSESKARSVLDTAREKNARLLKGAESFTESVSKGGSTLFRARFAGFDAEEAQAACKSLKRSGFSCFAQKI